MQLPQTCADLDAVLGAYAIGATTADENRAIEQLLPGCPEAQAALDEYLVVREALTHMEFGDVPTRANGDSLIAFPKLEPVAHRENSKQHDSRPTDPIAKLREAQQINRDRRPSASAAAWLAFGSVAAALIVVIGAGVVVNGLVRELRAERAALIALVEQSTTQTVTNAVPVQPRQGGYHTALMPTDDGVPGGQAQVIWDDETGVGLLTVSGMPSPQVGERYQVWLIEDDQPISVGAVMVGEDGTGFLIFETRIPLTSYDMIGVNVETSDEVAAPTTPHLMVGTL
ncbi:MAG: anti-sigma factor [Chloroflexota bacterium]